MTIINKFKERLFKGDKILLAGACGTEIQRRGVRTELPLWSACALLSNPDLVRSIHEDYIEAGADIINTNTFRTNRRTLAKAGLENQAKELTSLAVNLAKEGKDNGGLNDVVIGGSIAPLEDCYEPDLVPTDKELLAEHFEHAENLAEAGVDLLFIETINSIREAEAALKAAQSVGLDSIVSFVCNKDGDLLSGESIKEAFVVVKQFKPLAVLTNCSPPEIAELSLRKLLECTDLPVGIYANGSGCPHDELGWKFSAEFQDKEYLEFAKRWYGLGAQIVGGCCGTTPEYIGLIKDYLVSDLASP